MTLKTNANQQSTVTYLGGERHVLGRATHPVPTLRRISRHPGRFLVDAMVVPGTSCVNVNLEDAAGDLSTEVTPALGALLVETESLPGQRRDSDLRLAAGLDEDEDEDEDDDGFDDDDELDEDDEDLEDEDDEEFDDDLEDEDDDLDDDDLDDDEDEVEDEE